MDSYCHCLYFGRVKLPVVQEAFDRLLSGDRILLSRLISLAESPLPDHRLYIAELLSLISSIPDKSRRIGITGVPGAGKSTFINVLGKLLTAKGHKVAVLAVDPSSNRSGGSILGDKTRMSELAEDPNAYIRPSPTSGFLGGVNAGTRTAVRLCEAAGFDHIIIETVGVGQSETAVENLVDYLILLMLPGSGDELQGIKRGIMEIADAIVINKADGVALPMAQKALTQYRSALKLFPPHPAGWKTPVTTCSAQEKSGFNDILESIQHYFQEQTENGYLGSRRKSQKVKALQEILREILIHTLLSDDNSRKEVESAEINVKENKADPVAEATRLAFLFKTTS